MLHLHTMPPSSSSSSPHSKPKKQSPSPSQSPSLLCKHSPSATLDILILILVLFSITFLLFSYLSYIFQSLSQILPPLPLPPYHHLPIFYILAFLILFTLTILSLEICFSYRSRKCEKGGCKGLRNALEFDIKLETEESLKFRDRDFFQDLPWKGGNAGNKDYECLRSELRKMAPVNGRAVLLFRAKCGCPVAKLEAWGAKRGRRQKKALSNVVTNGGGNKQR